MLLDHIKMTAMRGPATMYMRFPLCHTPIPVLGSCSVEDKTITVTFPLSKIAFESPIAPKDIKDAEETFNIDFQVLVFSSVYT